ncbi:hypothetical protein AAMO2058_001701500 [Amorphochlora amoebiformis]
MFFRCERLSLKMDEEDFPANTKTTPSRRKRRAKSMEPKKSKMMSPDDPMFSSSQRDFTFADKKSNSLKTYRCRSSRKRQRVNRLSRKLEHEESGDDLTLRRVETDNQAKPDSSIRKNALLKKKSDTSSDEDAPLKPAQPKGPTDPQLVKAARAYLLQGDLSVITQKKVRNFLEKKFEINLKNRKPWIKSCVNSILKDMDAEGSSNKANASLSEANGCTKAVNDSSKDIDGIGMDANNNEEEAKAKGKQTMGINKTMGSGNSNKNPQATKANARRKKIQKAKTPKPKPSKSKISKPKPRSKTPGVRSHMSRKALKTSTAHNRIPGARSSCNPKKRLSQGDGKKRELASMVLALSGCDDSVQDIFHTVANEMKARTTDEPFFCTHLVSNGSRTLKVLFALANGAWILKPSWLYETVGTWKFPPEEQHLHSNAFPGVRRRSEDVKGLLAGKAVFIQDLDDPPLDVLISLVKAMGGKVALNFDSCDICIASESYRPNSFEATRAKVVKPQWLFDSLTNYSVKNVEAYAWPWQANNKEDYDELAEESEGF